MSVLFKKILSDRISYRNFGKKLLFYLKKTTEHQKLIFEKKSTLKSFTGVFETIFIKNRTPSDRPSLMGGRPPYHNVQGGWGRGAGAEMGHPHIKVL